MALGWKNQYLKYRQYSRNIYALYQKRDDLKMFLETLLSLGVIILFGIFALKPTALTVSQLYREIKNKEKLVNDLDTKITALDKAQNVLMTNAETILTLDLVLGGFPQPDLFSLQIEKLAEKNGVSLGGLSFNDVVIKGTPGKESPKTKNLTALPANSSGTPFSLTLTGSYPNLFNFLGDLENLKTPIVTDTVNINKGKSKDSPVLSLTVAGRLVYVPNEIIKK